MLRLLIAGFLLTSGALGLWLKGSWLAGEWEARSAQQQRDRKIAAAPAGQLRTFLEDDDAELRRMAAVRLAQNGDASGRAVLAGSLYPQTVFAASSGVFLAEAKAGVMVNAGQTIARIGRAALRSPIYGELRRYYPAAPPGYMAGHRVAEIVPGEASVKQAIEAIASIGNLSDAGELELLAKAFPQYRTEAMAASQKIHRGRK